MHPESCDCIPFPVLIGIMWTKVKLHSFWGVNTVVICRRRRTCEIFQKFRKMDVNTLCLHNKFGHCKFRDTCRHRHVYSLCDTDNCDISSCDKRHPRICRYYLNYGRCKFDPCSYSHAVNNVDNEKVAKIHDYIADVMCTSWRVLLCQILRKSIKWCLS